MKIRTFAVASLLGFLLLGSTASPQGKKIVINQRIKEAARATNEMCPVMIDDETRMDSVTAGPGKAFNYYYTLINIAATDIDSAAQAELMRPSLILGLQTSEVAQPGLHDSATLNYRYYDRNGAPVLSFELLPEEYLTPIDFQTQLMITASMINQNCPVMVDEMTRLDSTAAGVEHRLDYFYTMVTLVAGSPMAEEMVRDTPARVIEQVSIAPDLQIYRDSLATLGYTYFDMEGTPLLTFDVGPSEYGDQ